MHYFGLGSATNLREMGLGVRGQLNLHYFDLLVKLTQASQTVGWGMQNVDTSASRLTAKPLHSRRETLPADLGGNRREAANILSFFRVKIAAKRRNCLSFFRGKSPRSGEKYAFLE